MSRTAMTRRQFVGAAASAVGWYASRGLSAAEGANRSDATIDIMLNEPIGAISPELYGHFTEHIGGVIYDGIWVGEGSAIPNIDGIRTSLVEWMRRLKPAVVRWPGGCFADRYHWRDGIGPRGKRPRRYGRWNDVTESNAFGTHEFVRFCRLVNAEPYFAANVGSGSPEEFQSWVEYCNAPPGSTTLADERGSNGSPDPFRIRYWGVGNESWGCGGTYTPEDYCTDYRRFSTWVPGYGIPPYLIASGPSGNDLKWTQRFLQKWVDSGRAPLNGWSPHYYCGTAGEALNFSSDQWYELLGSAAGVEKLIVDQWGQLAPFDPQHTIRLIIDEWGAWHKPGTEINKRHLFEQQSCLRDAMVAALTLDTFNRHADKVSMGNVAQLINNLHSLFLADGDKFVATPNFYVFEMYRPHQGATAVRTAIETPKIAYAVGSDRRELAGLTGSASINGKVLTLTLVNPRLADRVAAQVRIRGGSVRSGRRTILTHDQVTAHNTFASPNELVSRSEGASVSGPAFVLELPAKSITRWDLELG